VGQACQCHPLTPQLYLHDRGTEDGGQTEQAMVLVEAQAYSSFATELLKICACFRPTLQIPHDSFLSTSTCWVAVAVSAPNTETCPTCCYLQSTLHWTPTLPRSTKLHSVVSHPGICTHSAWLTRTVPRLFSHTFAMYLPHDFQLRRRSLHCHQPGSATARMNKDGQDRLLQHPVLSSSPAGPPNVAAFSRGTENGVVVFSQRSSLLFSQQLTAQNLGNGWSAQVTEALASYGCRCLEQLCSLLPDKRHFPT
jgi:hypothetical protein